jgi:hypothetical protein
VGRWVYRSLEGTLAKFIQFRTEDHQTLLIEMDDAPLVGGTGDSPSEESTGVKKVALDGGAQSTIVKADATFEQALNVVQRNASAFIKQITDMINRPSEVEMKFGLKITGELGLFAVAKAGAEANYEIKLVWKEKSEAALPARPTIPAKVNG